MTQIVFVTKEVSKLKEVFKKSGGRKVVVVNCGLESIPLPDSNQELSIVHPRTEDRTLSSLVNLGLSPEDDIFVLDDSTVWSIDGLGACEKFLDKTLQIAAVHQIPKKSSGEATDLNAGHVPIFATLYTREALRRVGVLDSSKSDISLAASDWGFRAKKKGFLIARVKLSSAQRVVRKSNSKSLFVDMESRDICLTAPDRNVLNPKRWEGAVSEKPWSFPVSVAIPHLGESLRLLKTSVQSWRAQTVRPFLDVRDTGSPIGAWRDLLGMEAEDLEVNLSRWRAQRRGIDYVSLAYQHAMDDCRTPYLILTHDDVLPTSQTLVKELLSLCNSRTPVVGYKRILPLGEEILSSSLIVLHMRTMDKLRATCSLRWYEMTHEVESDHSLVELPLTACLREADVPIKFIGEDTRAFRQTDQRIDHVGSYTFSSLYNPTIDVEQHAESAISDAEQRLRLWEK